ncbi:MAG: hypothetical protein JO139_03115 [Alphaproteobacteria bacterium]|nr:hypothetical protein [Alphaproteobacteria bacterium]
MLQRGAEIRGQTLTEFIVAAAPGGSDPGDCRS